MLSTVSHQGNANQTTMRYRFIPTRMATIRKTDIKCWWVCGEIKPLFIAGRNVKCYDCFGKIWQFLKKLNMALPLDLATPFLSIYPREMNIYVHTKTCAQMLTPPLFLIAKRWKQPKCPSTEQWKHNAVYPYNGILLSSKKEWSTDIYICRRAATKTQRSQK